MIAWALALLLLASPAAAQWQSHNYSAGAITGTLGVANGGTGAATGRAAATSLSHGYVLCQSAAASSTTGDTNENALATCTVPANALGANGKLRIHAQFSYTNSANTKNFRIRYSGAGGSSYISGAATTTASIQYLIHIANRGATNSQVGGLSGVGTTSSVAPVTSAVDTTAATTIVFTGQNSNVGETITLDSYTVELLPASGN